MSKPWIVPIHAPQDPRMGIRVRHIESGNDGDVCNSVVTHVLMKDVKDPYVIDIGVDEGWWSFFVADVNPSVTIDAFEPNPQSFQMLVPHLETCPQMRLHPFAISNMTGFLPFTLESGQSNSRSGGTHIVPCTTLDRYLRGKEVTMMKIDTEGHDLTILETLHPFLNRIHAILFECTVYWYADTRQECIEKTVKELRYLKSKYTHMYALSRRGDPPILTELTREEIEGFVVWCYENRCQTDIVVTNRYVEI
jgi:FkbM family methyltransferase